MHLLYIHQYFKFPDEKGGVRSYDLAKNFVDKGIKVTILTSDTSNNLRDRKWHKVERDGITVYKIDCQYNNNMGFYRRLYAFVSFAIRTTAKALRIDADMTLATSTPLSIAIPALIKKWFQNTPFIFEVRDVWPEVPIKMGIIKNKLLIKLLCKAEKVIYKNATQIVVLSTGMYKNICSRLPYFKDKLTVIPNIAEIERFSTILKPDIKLPLTFENKRIVLYCGTFGKVNGLSYVVELASKTLPYDKNIIYCLCGKGKELDSVLRYAEKLGVMDKNLFYLGVVSKNNLPYLYSIATVGSSYVADNPTLWDNSANKFFDTLAAGKPILINHEGWQAEDIREYKCGYVLPPKLDDDAVNKFIAYVNDNELIKDNGKNAFKLAQNKYSLPIAVDKYMGVFNSRIE